MTKYILQAAQYNDYDTVVTGLFQKLASEQPCIANHSLGVNRLAMEIAKQMECFDDLLLIYLNWGTLLHDIGKTAIPEEILMKPGELTLEEYEKISKHPDIGYQLLGTKLPVEVLEIVQYHHERYDGEGYPNGLAGERIPILARVCAVADALEAMTSDKPYRKAMSLQQACEELFWNSGTQFDPAIVNAFFKWEASRAKIAI